MKIQFGYRINFSSGILWW